MGLLAGISILSVVEIFYHLVQFRSKKIKIEPELQAYARTAWLNEDHSLVHLGNYIVNFFKTSDMHGARYTQDRTLGAVSRIFWALLLLSSITLCGIIVGDMIRHAEKSPVATRIELKSKDQVK